jgi:cold shock CspA family protein
MKRYIGLIYAYNPGATFGFIARNDVEKYREIYFRINDFEEYITPQIGDIVEFSEGINIKGLIATHIKLIDDFRKEYIHHKLMDILINRELLKNKYQKLHQAAFQYIAEICSTDTERREEVVRNIKSLSKEDISIYLNLLQSNQRKQLISIDQELIVYSQGAIVTQTQDLSENYQSRLYISSHDLYRCLKSHVLEEVKIEFESRTRGIYSLEDVREKLTSALIRGTRPGSRAESAKICMKYLIDKVEQSSHTEEDESYYKDISGLLRDCILLYHSSMGQDYLQRPMYNPKCKEGTHLKRDTLCRQ